MSAKTPTYPPLPSLSDKTSVVYASLRDQLHDFVIAAGFEHVVLGISGGIDSALVAALAADALGPSAVYGITMPSPYTSEESVFDADELAKNLGIESYTVSIDAIMKQFESCLETPLNGHISSVTRQNLQARIRANVLMTFSNEFRWLTLTCGNRSESMVGYATLFGDMAGAFAPIAPLYKGWVYELALYRNEQGPVIPQRIIEKAPSAELAPNQIDEDELGSYQVLDAMLFQLDQGRSVEDLISAGFDREAVDRITGLIKRNSFKQHFAAPGARLPFNPHEDLI